MWAVEIINFDSSSIFVSLNIPYFLLNCNFIKRWQRPHLLNGFNIFFLHIETGATLNVTSADILLIVIGPYHTKLRILPIQILNLQRYVRVQLLIWISLHWKSAWSYDGVSDLHISILWQTLVWYLAICGSIVIWSIIICCASSHSLLKRHQSSFPLGSKCSFFQMFGNLHFQFI